MSEETRVFTYQDQKIAAQVLAGNVYCEDSQKEFRKEVLVSTQGGRKANSARIKNGNGRLWSLRTAEGYEFPYDYQSAILAVPGDETDLAKCTPLELHKKCLVKGGFGVTFKLTKSKDNKCAMPYRSYEGIGWHILYMLRFEGEQHWFISEESFTIANDPAEFVESAKKKHSSFAAVKTPVKPSPLFAAPTKKAKEDLSFTVSPNPVQQAPMSQQPRSMHLIRCGQTVQSPEGAIGVVLKLGGDHYATVEWQYPTKSASICHISTLSPVSDQALPQQPQQFTSTQFYTSDFASPGYSQFDIKQEPQPPQAFYQQQSQFSSYTQQQPGFRIPSPTMFDPLPLQDDMDMMPDQSMNYSSFQAPNQMQQGLYQPADGVYMDDVMYDDSTYQAQQPQTFYSNDMMFPDLDMPIDHVDMPTELLMDDYFP